MSDTPRTDDEESKFRAEFLNRNGAPKDWLIVTRGEMVVLQDELSKAKALNQDMFNLWAKDHAELAEAKREGERYLELKRQIRAVGKMIPCTTGGTFENDPPDAIVDACRRENETLRAELDALREDKERLDWLEIQDAIPAKNCRISIGFLRCTRAAIDAARKPTLNANTQEGIE